MIRLSFENKKYNLPTDFSEVYVGDYMEITSIDKELKDIDRIVKTISILTGLSEENVKSINIKQFNILTTNINFVYGSYNGVLVDRFKIDGIKYGFNTDLDDMQMSEWIDTTTLSEPDKINENLHKLLAILYRPVKKWKRRNFWSYLKDKEKQYVIEKYNSDEVEKRSIIFKEKLTMDKALGSLVFFSILKTASSLRMMGFSGDQLKEKMREMIDLELIVV